MGRHSSPGCDQVIAVDIPIDRAGLGARPTDAAARAFVGGSRASSVFPTPPRGALEARAFGEANEIARTITSKGISQQSRSARRSWRCSSSRRSTSAWSRCTPKVSFCELGGVHVFESQTPAGLERRREILDSAVGAWIAARYSARKAQAVPSDHSDRLGPIWR